MSGAGKVNNLLFEAIDQFSTKLQFGMKNLRVMG